MSYLVRGTPPRRETLREIRRSGISKTIDNKKQEEKRQKGIDRRDGEGKTKEYPTLKW